MIDDRVKRSGDRRKRAKLLDQPIARLQRARTKHRIPGIVSHGLGPQGAVFIAEDLHQPDRETLGKVIDHILARRQIDLERLAFVGRQVGQPPVKHGLGGRNQLDDNGVAVLKCPFHRREQAGQFHRE